ncbi:MAG: hypothetical protein AAB558_04395 [Patescibacteria group bacterium]
MKKILTLTSLLVGSCLLATPALAATRSDSEKLQNKIDNFETNMDMIVDDLAAAQDLELEDDSIENADYELAVIKYNEAYPILSEAVVKTQGLLSVTKYINTIPEQDTKIIRISFRKLIAQIQTYQEDLDAGLALAGDEETADDGLGEVETSITDARNYISSNKRVPHDAVEDYLKNFDNAARLDYEGTLEDTQEIYDLYVELFSTDEIQKFKTRFTNASAYYSDGVALYNKGITSDEDRDLQLLNRAAKKYKKVRYWLKLTNDAISTLSVQL